MHNYALQLRGDIDGLSTEGRGKDKHGILYISGKLIFKKKEILTEDTSQLRE